jgi:hypothetical protein
MPNGFDANIKSLFNGLAVFNYKIVNGATAQLVVHHFKEERENKISLDLPCLVVFLLLL